MCPESREINTNDVVGWRGVMDKEEDQNRAHKDMEPRDDTQLNNYAKFALNGVN